MPDRRQRQLLTALLLVLAMAGGATASPASEEKLRWLTQRGAQPQPPGAERRREREALLRQAEAALAAGDAAAAEQGFDRAAMILHSADTEMGLVRSYMQSGQYRRALAFGAHTAGAHLDVVGGAALYAWLLHAGAQEAIARKLLLEAQAREPSQPLVSKVRQQLASAAPRADGEMLVPPARLAPYGSSAGLPRGARVTATGTLVGDGRMALVPAGAVSKGGPFWVRNGLGQLAAATVLAGGPAGEVALLRLSSALPAPSIGSAPDDAFPGSPVYVAGYVDASNAAPAWPLMHVEFLGAANGPKGARTLDAQKGVGSLRGGPVLDQAGRLVGVALRSRGATRLLPVSGLRVTFAKYVDLKAGDQKSSVGADSIYESALLATLQVISAR